MKKSAATVLAAALLTLPAVALAHTGQGDHSFLDGFTHPLMGVDHLLAMLVVGVWSMLNSRRVWLAPLCFVAFLAIGALLGQQGLQVPQLEPLVAASVVVLGIMLAWPRQAGSAVSLMVIGGFALFHGVAHGGELSSGSSVLAGIVLGSALLHAAGMTLAHFVLKSRPQLTFRLGQLVAVFGGGLVLSAVL